MTTYSPYACSPVAIDVGPGLATYSVPKHLLRSPRWSTTESGGTLCLPGVSAPTGHTLVHYLYTGTYQTLEAKGEEAVVPAQTEFKQALWTFVFASAYELHDLERLAKEQIETHGSRMAFVELLDTSKQEFSKMTWCWFHDYLQARARKEFDLDYTIFTSEAFMESAGEGKLLKFMTCLLLEMFSEKLAQTMQTKESPCLDKARPRAVLNEVEKAAVNAHHYPCYQGEHQPDMCTASDETSFDSLDVSCEQADDMISLKSSEWNEVSPTPPELEPVPAPEADPPAESVSEPGPVLDSSPTKEAEYTDRKKEEEVEVQAPAVATTSAATSAANNFNWVERTLGNVDWGSFTAPTTRGKKKKGKKGKVRHLGYVMTYTRALTLA
jgi:hypothetical protein